MLVFENLREKHFEIFSIFLANFLLILKSCPQGHHSTSPAEKIVKNNLKLSSNEWILIQNHRRLSVNSWGSDLEKVQCRNLKCCSYEWMLCFKSYLMWATNNHMHVTCYIFVIITNFKLSLTLRGLKEVKTWFQH